jgi:hypothetical protein
MTKTEYTFRVGDAVWAKMKGFAAWPGKIEIPTDGMKRPAMKKVSPFFARGLWGSF